MRPRPRPFRASHFDSKVSVGLVIATVHSVTGGFVASCAEAEPTAINATKGITTRRTMSGRYTHATLGRHYARKTSCLRCSITTMMRTLHACAYSCFRERIVQRVGCPVWVALTQKPTDPVRDVGCFDANGSAHGARWRLRQSKSVRARCAMTCASEQIGPRTVRDDVCVRANRSAHGARWHLRQSK